MPSVLVPVVGPRPVPSAVDFSGVGDSDGGPPSPRGPDAPSRGWATPPPPREPDGPSRDWRRDRVAMFEADNEVAVAGGPTREFAFADKAAGTVTVASGAGTTFTYGGLSHPESVMLADLNGDGIPDLIVADSGHDRVLVFPGLPGGRFDPGPGGFLVLAAGSDPAGITVGDLDGGAGPGRRDDLIIANRGSGDVSLFLGQGSGQGWSLATGPTLPAGSGPIRTALVNFNGDGQPDLFILNAGSADVTLYRGQGSGGFDVGNPTTFVVGQEPTEMLIGRFDHGPGLDLVTVNSGSDDLTFVANVLSDRPSTTTYASGGTQPDAAFAVDLNHDGTMDLVVANGGDGHVALLQPAAVGLRLAGVIGRADLPAPTAISAGDPSGNGFDLYAATAGTAAAAILHFDLGALSSYLSVPIDPALAIRAGDAELVAQLLPFGSGLDLVAVLWNGGEGPSANDRGSGSGGSPTGTTACGRCKGQEIEETAGTGLADEAGRDQPSPIVQEPADPSSWARYVLGLEEALGAPRGVVAAVALRDAAEAPDGPPLGGRAGAGRPGVALDADALDAVLGSLWLPASPGADPPSPEPPGGPGRAPGPPSTPDEPGEALDAARFELIPVVSSTILAARLILKATPPRPPTFRRKVGRRPGAGLPPRL